MSGQVTSTVADGVATITFDNLDRHNALTLEMAEAARQILAGLGGDRDLRVVILRGAGERAFMSGADVGEMENETRRVRFQREATEVIAAIGRLPVPVLAVVHGFCLGAGVAVAAEADLRLAADEARFGVPAARLGLAYPYDEVARLTALVGPGAAADILLSGRRASAEEALGWGLVQAVHPAQQLDLEAANLASSIARNAPLSVRTAKRAIRTAAVGDHRGEEREAVDRLVAGCATSEDYAEGRAAFRERRPPRFVGR